MSACKICNNSKSFFIFQNKTVCLKCDELLFDMEIELEDEQKEVVENDKVLHISKTSKNSTVVKK